jgi:hypothetical protein
VTPINIPCGTCIYISTKHEEAYIVELVSKPYFTQLLQMKDLHIQGTRETYLYTESGYLFTNEFAELK